MGPVIRVFVAGLAILAIFCMVNIFTAAGANFFVWFWDNKVWSEPVVDGLNNTWAVINRPAKPVPTVLPPGTAQPVRNVVVAQPAPVVVAAPARTLLREDFPEKRADGSIWMVRQWSDGSFQDLYQIQPPAAPAAQPARQAPASGGCQETSVPADTAFKVTAPCIIQGEAQLSDNENSGFRKMYTEGLNRVGNYTVVTRDAWAKGTWGFSTTKRPAAAVDAEMRASGCGSSCLDVNPHTW